MPLQGKHSLDVQATRSIASISDIQGLLISSIDLVESVNSECQRPAERGDGAMGQRGGLVCATTPSLHAYACDVDI
jgi:hypothetical protein